MKIKELIKKITRKEWTFLVIIAVITILITAVPYLYGYLTKPQGSIYTGIHHLTPGDTNVWLSIIEQTKQGHNIFINLYTSENQHRIFINPLWLSVGWMAKIFNLSNLLALNIARSIWIIIFIFIAYLFISYFFDKIFKRKIILLIILFSSGLGVFFNPFLFNVNNLIEHPTDIWVPESITFLTLLHSPHLIASLTLIILIFLLMLLAFENNKFFYSILAGIVAMFLFWFHPFNLPTAFLVIFTYLIFIFVLEKKVNWAKIKHFLILIILSTPSLFYLLWLNKTDYVINRWSAENILPSPSVWMYLIGYGLLLPLTILGFFRILKLPDKKNIFLAVWFFVSCTLLYIPLNFQRRLSEGLHIPISILAGLAIFYLLDIFKKDRKYYIISLFFSLGLIILLPLTNIQILGQDFYLFHQRKSLPYYLKNEYIEAFSWIEKNLSENEIILSSFYMGNFIPAYTGRIVYIGHGPQTIDLPNKEKIVEWFFNNNEGDKYKFLIDNKINYLFYSQKEKELGDYNPATKDYLKKVFENQEVAIYKITVPVN